MIDIILIVVFLIVPYLILRFIWNVLTINSTGSMKKRIRLEIEMKEQAEIKKHNKAQPYEPGPEWLFVLIGVIALCDYLT